MSWSFALKNTEIYFDHVGFAESNGLVSGGFYEAFYV